MKQEGILIIGGTGFIGNALARRMADMQRPIHILARHADVAPTPNIVMHRGSLDDSVLLRKILPHCGTVIHAASTTTPGVSARQPALDAMQNIIPTLRLLEVLHDFENRHLIFFSSGGTLYGNRQDSAASEHHSLAPLSYYGGGKAAIEAFLHAYRGQGGGPVTIFRPSNVYGAGQGFRPGFGLVRTMLEHVRRATPMEIWGDGEIVRDFIYVDDILDACVKFIDADNPEGIYNIGYGKGHSLNQVRHVIETVCGIQLDVKYQPARQIDVHNIVLDTTLLRNRIDWHPRISLDEGVALTWAWLNTSSPFPAHR